MLIQVSVLLKSKLRNLHVHEGQSIEIQLKGLGTLY